MTALYSLNQEHNGIEITFDCKPSIAVRGQLKENGFRWHKVKKLWYAKQTPERIELAANIVKGEPIPDADIIGGEVSDGYLGVQRWDGYKSDKSLYGGDLTNAIRADLKKHGMKGVTLRIKTYSGGQSITATVKASTCEFVPYNKWIQDKSIYDFTRYGRIAIDANFNEIPVDDFYNLPEDEQKKVFELNARHDYDSEKTTQCAQYVDRFTTFTHALRERIKKIDAIINTYRYDDSNGMVDYFNTNFYYDIVFKIVD